jgi:hypothetical protein
MNFRTWYDMLIEVKLGSENEPKPTFKSASMTIEP